MGKFVTVKEAQRLQSLGKPWAICMYNTTTRNAFWEACGNGLQHAYYQYGKIGCNGRMLSSTPLDVLPRAANKLKDNYSERILEPPSLVTSAIDPFDQVWYATWSDFAGNFVLVDRDLCTVATVPPSTVYHFFHLR